MEEVWQAMARLSISRRSWVALIFSALAAIALGLLLAWRLDLAQRAEAHADAAAENAARVSFAIAHALGAPALIDVAPTEPERQAARERLTAAAAQLQAVADSDPSLRAAVAEFQGAAALTDRRLRAEALTAAAARLAQEAVVSAQVAEAAGDSVDTRGDMLVWILAPLTAAGIIVAILLLIRDWRHMRDDADAMADARRRAEDAYSAKSLMLAAASHDVRQPLHAMSLLLSALKRRVEPGDQRALVEKIESAAESLQRLFGALLDVARLEAGIVRADRHPFPVQDMLAPLVAEADAIARARNGRVLAESTDLWLDTDAQLLEVIVRNLLSNAVKVSDGGEVRVAVRRDGANVSIEVADSGPAITQDRLDAILAGRPKAGERVGLGLFIVREMTKILGLSLVARAGAVRGAVIAVRAPVSAIAQHYTTAQESPMAR